MAACFSGDCGMCTICCGGDEVVTHIITDRPFPEDPGTPQPLPVDTWGLYQEMVATSNLYRWNVGIVCRKWDILTMKLIRRNHYFELYKDGGVMHQIRESHIEFLKGCTKESFIYGAKRSLKIPTYFIHMAIENGEVDINQLGGKVVCSGGGLFDLDTMKKSMNLGNEEYENYFDKFKLYLSELKNKMAEYDVELGQCCRGCHDFPYEIRYGGEIYTFTDDTRAVCDDPECCLMTHCMLNWDGVNIGSDKQSFPCYTGKNPPEKDSYYYGHLVGQIPIYTRKKTHELCLLCILKDTP